MIPRFPEASAGETESSFYLNGYIWTGIGSLPSRCAPKSAGIGIDAVLERPLYRSDLDCNTMTI